MSKSSFSMPVSHYPLPVNVSVARNNTTSVHHSTQPDKILIIFRQLLKVAKTVPEYPNFKE